VKNIGPMIGGWPIGPNIKINGFTNQWGFIPRPVIGKNN
jgi:hypothetical protein